MMTNDSETLCMVNKIFKTKIPFYIHKTTHKDPETRDHSSTGRFFHFQLGYTGVAFLCKKKECSTFTLKLTW